MENPAQIAFHDRWKPANLNATRDTVESVRVGKAIRAVPGQCWFNCRRAIRRLHEYSEAIYVEGWAVLDDVLPIEHAWVRRGDAVIDPTMPDKRVVYFPGLEFPGRVGVAEFLKTREGRRCRNTPLFHAFGWGGKDSPGFIAAWESAMAYVRERAAAAGRQR